MRWGWCVPVWVVERGVGGGLGVSGYFLAHPAVSWPTYPRRLRMLPASGKGDYPRRFGY